MCTVVISPCAVWRWPIVGGALLARLAYPNAQHEAITLTCLHVHFETERAMLMKASIRLTDWVAQDAEQLNSATISQRVREQSKQTITGMSLSKNRRLLEIVRAESGNYGF